MLDHTPSRGKRRQGPQLYPNPVKYFVFFYLWKVTGTDSWHAGRGLIGCVSVVEVYAQAGQHECITSVSEITRGQYLAAKKLEIFK